MPTAAAYLAQTRAPALPSGGLAAGLLVACAVSPVVRFVLGRLGVGIPYGTYVFGALGLVAVVLTLVWLHATFVALRGRTKFSSGMAVGGWFIPIANLFLPALIFRDAWRASLGRGGGIAFLWMIAWWLSTSLGMLRGMGVQFSSVDRGPVMAFLPDGPKLFEIPGISMETFVLVHTVLNIGVDVVAYGLLAYMVTTIARSQPANP